MLTDIYGIRRSYLLAGIISFILFGLSIFKLYVGAKYAALGFFILIPCVYITAICGIRFWLDHVMETSSAIGLIITAVSIFAVLESSPVFDIKNQQKNTDLFEQSFFSARCLAQPDEGKRAKWHQLKDKLMVMCVSQGHFDMINLGFDLIKASRLDPISSTIDSVNNDFFSEKPITCQDIARQMEDLCPNSLKRF